MSTSVTPAHKSHPLDGIREKLERANQCIRNLDSEIVPFLAKFPSFDFPLGNPGEDPVFADQERDAWDKFRFNFMAIERENPIPLRFAVLAGEIIHHLRSCFDHLAWQLSDETCRGVEKVGRYIEFPIFDDDPATDPKKLAIYDRKIKCITARPNALARIKRLQPYCSSDPLDTPLWRIHDMDRTDKHRELALVIATAGARFEATWLRQVVTVSQAGIPIGEVPLPGIFDMKMNTKVAAFITFGQPIKGELQPVIPFLQQLLSFTSDTVESFAEEFS